MMIVTATMTDTVVRVSMLATSPLEQGNAILNTSSANTEGNFFFFFCLQFIYVFANVVILCSNFELSQLLLVLF